MSDNDPTNILFILGRLEGKVDALISQFTHHQDSLTNHERRLQELERNKAWIFGVSASLSGCIALAVNLYF